jgi:hypothetical protein
VLTYSIYSSLLGDNVIKPDLGKENECLIVETYSQYTEQDLDRMSSSRLETVYHSMYNKGSKSVLNGFKSY